MYAKPLVMNRLSAINQKYDNNTQDRIIKPDREGSDAARMQVVHEDAHAIPFLFILKKRKSKAKT